MQCVVSQGIATTIDDRSLYLLLKITSLADYGLAFQTAFYRSALFTLNLGGNKCKVIIHRKYCGSVGQIYKDI